MALKRTLARNLSWNWAGMIAGVVVAFLTAPLLVLRLGDSGYGLWILLGSLSGYFALLDLGIRGSVGRFVAYYRGKGDQDRVNATLNTALAILGVLGLLATLGIAVLAARVVGLFDVPADRIDEARLALLIVGVNLGLTLLLNPFDAVLWAFQRFDRLNQIDVPMEVARLGLTYWLVDGGRGSLITLAWITLATTLAAGGLKAILSFAPRYGIRLGIGYVRKSAMRDYAGYGTWNFITALGRLTTAHGMALVVGSTLGLALVTPLALARRLIQYASMVLTAGSGILTPVVASLDAVNDEDRNRRIFLEGGRVAFLFAWMVLGFNLLLGPSFIRLWVGPELVLAAQLLIILSLGEVLPLSQNVTISVLQGRARNRLLALLSVVENVAGLSLAAFLAGRAGLPAACMALSATGALCRGFGVLTVGCRVMRISMGRYFAYVVAPTLLVTLAPVGLLAMLVVWSEPSNWAQLIGYGVVFVSAQAIASALLILGSGHLISLIERHSRMLLGIAGTSTTPKAVTPKTEVSTG